MLKFVFFLIPKLFTANVRVFGIPKSTENISELKNHVATEIHTRQRAELLGGDQQAVPLRGSLPSFNDKVQSNRTTPNVDDQRF